MGEINKNLRLLMANHNAKADRKPIICLEGSARSGKTWAALEYIIQLLHQQKLIATVFRHDAATHDKAAARDFQELMLLKYLPIWNQGRWNKQLKTFTFHNGSVIEFAGTNDPAKLHGPARDLAFLNEVTEISYEAYRQITARTTKLVICDWNPSLSKHWVFSRVITRDDCAYQHSTFRDNPHLSDKIIAEIEATEPTPENKAQGTADLYFWQVYGLGMRAKREGVIYKDFFICEPEEWPEAHNTQRHGYGLDFGFSADPCAMIECCLFQSKIYVREIFYETGLITCKSHANPNTPSIQGHLEAMDVQKSAKIVADSARPEQIAELNNEGYCVTSVKKYKGSIVAGIDLLCHYPIYVHRQSTNIQLELDQYAWRRSPAGDWLNEPEDKWNHALDAIRYWAQEELPRLSMEGVAAYQGRIARKFKRY